MRFAPAAALASCVFACTAFAPRTAAGQVNIEVVRRRVEDKPFLATIEASFTGRMGNIRNSVFSASALAGFNASAHRGFVQGTLDYWENAGVPTVARAFVHGRYNYKLGPIVFADLFGQVQSDRFQRLTYRALFGLGPRFVLFDDDDFDVNLGTSYMFEHEELNVPAGFTFPAVREANRWNNYLSVGYRVGELTEMVATLYVQPRLDDFGDNRMLGEASLLLKVTKVVVARMGVLYRFQSRPPPLVVETDLEVRNSLGLSF